jgi:hypothetical protein
VDVQHVVTQLLLHLAASQQTKTDAKGLKWPPRLCEDAGVRSTPASPKSVTSKRERTVRTCSAESSTSNSNNLQGFDIQPLMLC